MEETPLFSLVYASDAARPLADTDLDAILARSRDWSHTVGLTGMLLFKDESFMQVLEGPERMVRKTFRFIRKDRRHRDVRILSESQVSSRQFGPWTMGFRRVTDDTPAVGDGYTEFLFGEHAGPSWSSPTPARVLLDWFRLHGGRNAVSSPPPLYRV